MYKVIAICKGEILTLNVFADKSLAIKYAEEIKDKYKGCKIRVLGFDEETDLILP